MFEEKELIFLLDKDIFLTKHKLTEKIKGLLLGTEREIQQFLQPLQKDLPPQVFSRHPKLSKGENYRQQPYMILDYPRLFLPDEVFAFRTMFLWGHFFSTTLHLQGKMLDPYRKELSEKANHLKNSQVYLCVGAGPWEYHYEDDNYLLIDQMPDNLLQDVLEKKNFIKLSRKIPLQESHLLEGFCIESFQIFFKALGITK